MTITVYLGSTEGRDPAFKTAAKELGTWIGANGHSLVYGGTGTLEEIAEVISKVTLRHLDAPCILYNLNGYYNDLRALLDHMVEMELCTKEKLRGVYFADNLAQIKEILKG